ncbi:hypothetical protein Daus18300_003450 [Diaporthe australafricana]|uniref:Ecp2 effector protein domain-containing protein n=1 Tax=Diaporthe australafricana TaxID=127596 RepID=A0ABR3XFD5_9PEZI
MKFTMIVPALLAIISAVAAAALPNEGGKPLADGYYRTYIDASGETINKFTPLSELINATETPIEARSELQDRDSIQKRREGCGGYVSTYDSDQANAALINTFSRNDVIIAAGDRRSIVWGTATSFVCAYSSGTKYKPDIAGSWSYVKNTLCGQNRGGYAQVVGGSGDWTAGFTWNGDHYC